MPISVAVKKRFFLNQMVKSINTIVFKMFNNYFLPNLKTFFFFEKKEKKKPNMS